MLNFDTTDKTLHLIKDDTGEDLGTFCEGFKAKEVRCNICNGSESIIFKAYTAAGVKRFLVPAKDLLPLHFPRYLLDQGVTFLADSDISASITAYALESKAAAPIKHTYDKLGWLQRGKKRYYLGGNLVDATKIYDKYSHEAAAKFAAKGSFSVWRDGLLPFLSRPEVALALIIGASAPIVPLLKESGIFTETMIFALIGRSSTYKTTMLKMMAGIFGKPSLGDGVIDTTIDTTAYFFHNLGKKNGFIHCVDDISAAQGHDFSNDLYTISMGKSRGRLSPDGVPKNVETWCTTMVYTGESSIFNQTNRNAGLYARLVEFSNEWLTDKEDINGFYEIIGNNYGVAIVPLVQTLLKLSEQEIRDLFEESLREVNKEIQPSDGVGRRITQRFAVLVMTLLTCNLAWGLQIQIPPIIKLLKVAYEDNLPPSDYWAEAIQKIREQILNNGNLFLKNPDGGTISQRAWGVYGSHNYRRCLWVIKGKMEEIARDAGISSLKAAQRELADRGLLVRDSGNHYTFHKRIDAQEKVECYGVFLEARSTTAKKNPKKAKNKRLMTQRNLLLDDKEEDVPLED